MCPDMTDCVRQINPEVAASADRSRFCPPDKWLCDDESFCLSSWRINNGKTDCLDGSDEEFKEDDERHMDMVRGHGELYVEEGQVLSLSMPFKGLCRERLKPCGSRSVKANSIYFSHRCCPLCA